jgi:hypothetical protein
VRWQVAEAMLISQGLTTVNRAVISRKEKKESESQLLVTGYGLREVMGTEGAWTETSMRTIAHNLQVSMVL